jgi:hypothetical protein
MKECVPHTCSVGKHHFIAPLSPCSNIKLSSILIKAISIVIIINIGFKAAEIKGENLKADTYY